MSTEFMTFYAKQLCTLLPPRRRLTAVQAGGYTGIVPRILSQAFERVVTFEPSQSNIPHLLETCQNTSVRVMQAALSDKRTRLQLATSPARPDLTHVDPTTLLPSGPDACLAIPLDELAFMAVDLLAIDVAGWEYEVLEGATDTIYKHKPVIVVELGKKAVGGRRNDVPIWLRDHGYLPFHFISSDACYYHVDDTEMKEYHDGKTNPPSAT